MHSIHSRRAPLPTHSASVNVNLAAAVADVAAAAATTGSEYSLPPSYRAPLVHNSNNNNNTHMHSSSSALIAAGTASTANATVGVGDGHHDASVGPLDRTFTSSTSINNNHNQQYHQPNHQALHQNVLIDVANNSKPMSTQLCEVITHQPPTNTTNNNNTDANAGSTEALDAGQQTDREKDGALISITAADEQQKQPLPTNSSGGNDDTEAATDSPIIVTTTLASNSSTPTKQRAGHDLVTIVTISGCTETESSTGEMDILAHL